jgi:AAA domain
MRSVPTPSGPDAPGLAETSTPPGRFRALTTRQLMALNRRQRWLVDGVFLARQPAIIGGPAKCLKTAIAVDLAVSLASATPFLGHFRVPSRKLVLFMSGETMYEVLLQRALRVAESRNVDLADFDSRLGWEDKVPRLDDPVELADLQSFLRDSAVRVLIIDPLYFCLPVAGGQASNLYAMGPLLHRFAAACLAVGTTPILVHHISKTAASKKTGAVLEVNDLSQAGAAEFARGWLLINRREPVAPDAARHELALRIGGSANYGSVWDLDADVGVLQPDFSGTTWNVQIRPRVDEEPPGPRGRTREILPDPWCR